MTTPNEPTSGEIDLYHVYSAFDSDGNEVDIDAKVCRVSDHRAAIAALRAEIARLVTRIEAVDLRAAERLDAKDALVAALRSDVVAQGDLINALRQQIAELLADMDGQQREMGELVAEQDAEIERLTAERDAAVARIEGETP